jgi:hypothetical protein
MVTFGSALFDMSSLRLWWPGLSGGVLLSDI